MLADLPRNHDLAHLTKALSFVKNWRLAIDGGAHRGIWTRVLLSKFQTVVAFEPCKENAVHIPKEAMLFERALGDVHKRRGLVPGTENTGQWHLRPGDEVDVVPLDSFRFAECDFLKLDVEGYELKALMGARQTIQRCKPVVMIEENGLCSRYGAKWGDAEAYLVELGMRKVATCKKDLVFVCEP